MTGFFGVASQAQNPDKGKEITDLHIWRIWPGSAASTRACRPGRWHLESNQAFSARTRINIPMYLHYNASCRTRTSDVAAYLASIELPTAAGVR